MDQKILTLEQVILETKAFFADGKGNPALEEPMIKWMNDKKEVPQAVLVSLDLERIVGYRRK